MSAADPSSSLPVLDPETVRQLLRECVTVVKPGEVLFWAAGDPNWTPTQIRAIQDVVNWWLDDNAPEVRVMVLPHGEMAVAESVTDEAFAERVGRVMPEILRREMRRQSSNTVRA